jgi:integrase
MPLTDTAVRNAKARPKLFKLFDERGLYLEVTPNGSKWWRLKYRFDGKEKRLSLGVYPDVTLSVARDRRDEARKLVAGGVDPSENRKAQKATNAQRAANSFEVVAREWHRTYSERWTPGHGDRILRRLERDIFPWLGDRPVADVEAPELLSAIRRIEQRGALETAHRSLTNTGQVFRYAIATGRAKTDPSRDLRGALPPAKKAHFAATTEPARLGAILRAMEGYEGSLIVRCALRLAPLVFVRPGELRKSEWIEVDLDAGEWRYSTAKTDTQHIVPLARQAVEILAELRPLTERSKYVFPNGRSFTRPMSDNAVLAAMRRMGIGKEEMSGHGFRAVARTLLDEVLNFRPDYIEHQLAHAVRDPNGRAYNRTAHLSERKGMMQIWADYLDKLKSGADIVALAKQA